jgi:hypothetical protein
MFVFSICEVGWLPHHAQEDLNKFGDMQTNYEAQKLNVRWAIHTRSNQENLGFGKEYFQKPRIFNTNHVNTLIAKVWID